MTTKPPNHKPWQPKILAINRRITTTGLVDNTENVYVCNNCKLITKFYNKSMQIGSSILDRISSSWEKIPLWLSQQDGTKEVLFNLNNLFFFPYSPLNLVSLGLLNDHGIYYNNKDKTLYDKESKQIFTYTQ